MKTSRVAMSGTPPRSMGIPRRSVWSSPISDPGITWITEIALLVLSALLFLIGRAGWAWLLGCLAAGTAALAAAADVWINPDR